MSTPDLQVQLFQQLKDKLPPQSSLVDEVASVLDISTDSAYRRIRNEKSMSLEEVYLLCSHFKLSLDALLNLQSDTFSFSGSFIETSSFQFDQWLKSVLQQVKYMTGFREKKMYTVCKDIPIFHHFHFRELAAFKHFVWMKGIYNSPEFARKKFSLKNYPSELFELGQKALSLYNQIDSVEIWSLETINSTMRQIDYYHESNLFENEEEVMLIYESLEKLMTHLDRQATLGYKFNVGETERNENGTFQMYLNEIIIGDNSILASLDGSKISFIIHTVANIMMTRDMRFCENMYDSVQNLMKRSTQISSVSERERARFFKYLRKRIAGRKQHLRV
jgi:hypothetical protein